MLGLIADVGLQSLHRDALPVASKAATTFLGEYGGKLVAIAFVVSAVITPTGDMVTQSVLAVPMIGLYLLGVMVAWLFGKPRRAPERSLTAEAGTR